MRVSPRLPVPYVLAVAAICVVKRGRGAVWRRACDGARAAHNAAHGQDTGDYFEVRATGAAGTYVLPPLYIYGSGNTAALSTALPGGSLAVANASVFRDSGSGDWEVLDSLLVGGGVNASWRAAAVGNAAGGNLAVVVGAGGAVGVLDPTSSRLLDVSPSPAVVAAAQGGGAGAASSGSASVDFLGAVVVAPTVRAAGLPPSDPEAWVVGTSGVALGYTPRDGTWRWPTPATAGDAAVLAGATLRSIAALGADLWAVGGTAAGGALIARIFLNASSAAIAVATMSPRVAGFLIEVVDTGLGAGVTGGAPLYAVDATAMFGVFAVGARALVLRRFRPSGVLSGGEVWAVVPTTVNATRTLCGIAVGYAAIGVRAAGEGGTVLASVTCASATDEHVLDLCRANATATAAAGGVVMVSDLLFPSHPADTFTAASAARTPVSVTAIGASDGRMYARARSRRVVCDVGRRAGGHWSTMGGNRRGMRAACRRRRSTCPSLVLATGIAASGARWQRNALGEGHLRRARAQVHVGVSRDWGRRHSGNPYARRCVPQSYVAPVLQRPRPPRLARVRRSSSTSARRMARTYTLRRTST